MVARAVALCQAPGRERFQTETAQPELHLGVGQTVRLVFNNGGGWLLRRYIVKPGLGYPYNYWLVLDSVQKITALSPSKFQATYGTVSIVHYF